MKILTMKAIERDFPDQWLLVEVTESQDGVPVKGVVLKASREREEVVGEIARHGEKKLFLFFNGIAVTADTAFALRCSC